jgi:hypothetical protein
VEVGDLEIKREEEGCGKRNVFPVFREGRYQTHFIGVSGNLKLENGNLCKRWLDINEEVAYRKMLS